VKTAIGEFDPDWVSLTSCPFYLLIGLFYIIRFEICGGMQDIRGTELELRLTFRSSPRWLLLPAMSLKFLAYLRELEQLLVVLAFIAFTIINIYFFLRHSSKFCAL
jgi:hypothetical protein